MAAAVYECARFLSRSGRVVACKKDRRGVWWDDVVPVRVRGEKEIGSVRSVDRGRSGAESESESESVGCRQEEGAELGPFDWLESKTTGVDDGTEGGSSHEAGGDGLGAEV
jgi:hypothetical protein